MNDVRVFRSDREPVYSGGDDTTPFDHVLIPAMESHGVDYVRFELERENDSGSTIMQLFVEYSDDGKTWSDGPKPFGSAYSADGTDRQNTYTQLSTVTGVTVRGFLRFGVRVKNTTSVTGVEMVRVRITIEAKKG